MESIASHASIATPKRKQALVWLRHIFVIIIIFIGLGLRIGYVTSLETHGPPIRADAAKYYRLAYNLTENGVYSLNHRPPYSKDQTITPGYPLFLASILLATSIEKFYYSTLYTQAVLSTLTILLIYFLFLGIIPWPALVCGILLLSLSPHLIVYSGYVLTETLFTFLVALGMLFYRFAIEKKSIILSLIAGAYFGMSALTRPALLLFPIALLIFSWLFSSDRKNMLKKHLLILCGLIALWIPWKFFTLDAPPTYSAAAASFALGSYPDLTFKKKQFRGYPYREDPTTYSEMIQSFKTGIKVVSERTRQAPGKYFTWYLFGKPKMFWGASSVAGAGGAFQYPIKSSIYNTQKLPNATYVSMMSVHGFLAILALFYALFTISKAALTRNYDSNQLMLISSGLLLLYFTSIHTILTPLPRYAVPLYPFCYILAVGAVSALIDAAVKFSNRKTS